MTSSSAASDEMFSQAGERWDLDRLYRELAVVKQEPLTPGEKEYLRGLLLGYEPKDIADSLHRSANGVRVALSHLYQLLGQLSNLPPGKVNSRTVERLLEQAGYRRQPESGRSHTIAVAEYYVDRPPTESNCYETILQPGSLIRIKAPQQMGKTLLLFKIIEYTRRHRYRTVTLDFRLFEQNTFRDLDSFLRCFCSYVGWKLELPDQISERWTPTFGSNINCTAYFEEYLLPAIDSPLVLGLDNVDLVFQFNDIAADFLGLLRAWYEGGRSQETWQKLRLILVHSTEVYVPLGNNQSPFNVGFPVDLREFRPEEVWELARSCQFNWQGDQIEQITQLVGGHPYLVQLALDVMVQQGLTLAQLIERAPTDSGPFAAHLRRHLLCLEEHLDLAEAMMNIVAASEPIRLNAAPALKLPSMAFKLHSMGLVHLDGNRVRIRNQLYRQYFRDHLIQENDGHE